MNQLTKKLGIQLPIIQAPMAGVSTPQMAAAVSNAGALGSIGIGAVNAEAAKRMILATKALTDRPFNVNVFCHHTAARRADCETAWLATLAPHFALFDAKPPEQLNEIYQSFLYDEETQELLLEERPAVVSFHFGMPNQNYIDKLKAAGVIVIASATNLWEAEKLSNAEVDAIVAQGYEAGGHRGIFDTTVEDNCLSTFALTRLLVSNMNLPIISAGGIMDGAGIAACLGLGASAAQLGTAFIACPESSADDFFKSALMSGAAYNTVMTRAISGRKARCLANEFTKLGAEIEESQIPDYPIAYDAAKTLHALAKAHGEGGYGAQWAGQGAPIARSMPAAALIAQLKLELDEALANRTKIADTLPADVSRAKRKPLECSFCGKNQNQVAKLIVGPGVHICNDCVKAFERTLTDPDFRSTKNDKCSFCGKRQDEQKNRRIVDAPGACICNECIALCKEILTEDLFENA